MNTSTLQGVDPLTALLVIGAIFVLMLLFGAILLGVLLFLLVSRRAAAPPLPFPPFVFPPFPPIPTFPPIPALPNFPLPGLPNLPGFDYSKFMECLCAGQCGGGGSKGPGGSLSDPGDVVVDIWHKLRDKADWLDGQLGEVRKWKDVVDKAVNNAGAAASSELKNLKTHLDEREKSLDQVGDQVKSGATEMLTTLVQSSPDAADALKKKLFP